MPARAWLSKIRKRPGVYGDRLSCSDVLNRVGFAALLRCPIVSASRTQFGRCLSSASCQLTTVAPAPGFWASLGSVVWSVHLSGNVSFGAISSEFSIRFRVGFDLNFGHIFASH